MATEGGTKKGRWAIVISPSCCRSLRLMVTVKCKNCVPSAEYSIMGGVVEVCGLQCRVVGELSTLLQVLLVLVAGFNVP